MDYIHTAMFFFLNAFSMHSVSRQPNGRTFLVSCESPFKSFRIQSRSEGVGTQWDVTLGPSAAWGQQGEVPLQRRLPCPSSKRMRRLRLALSILIHRKFGALSDLVNKKTGQYFGNKMCCKYKHFMWSQLDGAFRSVSCSPSNIHLYPLISIG